MQEQYRINQPSVIGEVIDGEAVVMNLDNGIYFGLGGCGSDIWSCLQRSLTPVEMTEFLQQRYDGPAEIIDRELRQFLQALAAESLIVKADRGMAVANCAALEQETGGPERKPFAAPELSKYTDMEHLLTLDPLHDVDEMGWPKPR